MAATVLATTQVLNSSSELTGSQSGSAAITGGADHVAVVIVGTLNNNNVSTGDTSTWSATVGGVTATLAASTTHSGVDPMVGVWYLVNPPSGTVTVAVDVVDTSRALIITLVELEGVDAASTLGATATSTSDVVSLTSTHADSLILSGTATQGDTGGFTGGADTGVELFDAQTGTANFNDVGLAIYSTVNSAASTSLTALGGTPSRGDEDRSFAVEFKSGGAAVTTTDLAPTSITSTATVEGSTLADVSVLTPASLSSSPAVQGTTLAVIVALSPEDMSVATEVEQGTFTATTYLPPASLLVNSELSGTTVSTVFSIVPSHLMSSSTVQATSVKLPLSTTVFLEGSLTTATIKGSI